MIKKRQSVSLSQQKNYRKFDSGFLCISEKKSVFLGKNLAKLIGELKFRWLAVTLS